MRFDFIFIILFIYSSTVDAADTVKCLKFNSTACKTLGSDSDECSGSVECTSCYFLFLNENNVIEPYLRGCWNTYCENSTCDSTITNANYRFCCCNTDNCNSNATVSADPFVSSTKAPTPDSPAQGVGYIVYTCIIILLMTLCGFAISWLFRKKHQPQFSGVPTSDDKLQAVVVTDTSQPIGPVHLLEEKAKGKFGSVYKGQLGNGDPVQYVAVKVFPPQDYESWRHEREIYRLPQMKHKNILNYLGSEPRGQPVEAYWLITEYHELGSLYDYLKANVVSYTELLKIGEGIASGLALLHDELPPKIVHDESPKEVGLKPALAHRDFKSKNVILKADLTPCIGDFGLARIFPPSEPHIEALGQVGTRKYMAPEVLDGAISFTKDSLLRIDMYACGLVLWELVSRCSAQEGTVPPHELPFDLEVGPNPTLEQMAEVVVGQKKRPKLPEFSSEYKEGWRELCLTIEELWDQDAEARLSALCVQQRFVKLIERQHN